MEFLQNIEGERAGHAKGEVVDEHSISEGVSICINLNVSYIPRWCWSTKMLYFVLSQLGAYIE